MVLDPEVAQARRDAMFTQTSSMVGSQTGVCNECGCLVYDWDAHFGWHLKIDNIDQRAERAFTTSASLDEAIREVLD
jgi:hypothetical protein